MTTEAMSTNVMSTNVMSGIGGPPAVTPPQQPPLLLRGAATAIAEPRTRDGAVCGTESDAGDAENIEVAPAPGAVANVLDIEPLRGCRRRLALSPSCAGHPGGGR